MFPVVGEYGGWRIERRPPGFEFTPGLLGKITTYLAVAPPKDIAIFAFMYSFLVTDGIADEERLAATAMELIHAVIDAGQAIANTEHTYELSGSGWQEVQDPAWWISVR